VWDLDRSARRPRKPIASSGFKLALDGAVPDSEFIGDPLRAPAKVTGPRDRQAHGDGMARQRPMRASAPGHQTTQVLGAVAPTSATTPAAPCHTAHSTTTAPTL
jgi:hypothetical protein